MARKTTDAFDVKGQFQGRRRIALRPRRRARIKRWASIHEYITLVLRLIRLDRDALRDTTITPEMYVGSPEFRALQRVGVL